MNAILRIVLRNEFAWPNNARLLLGEEGLGVPDNIKHSQFIKIPMASGVESLNATIAASIALHSHFVAQNTPGK